MSFLPIIYTSVLIFAAAMVVIILFSYLAFKIKGNKNNPAERYQNNIMNMPALGTINAHSSNRISSQSAAVFREKPSHPSNINPAPVTAKPRYTRKFIEYRERDNGSSFRNDTNEIKTRFRNSGQIRSPRLEIMTPASRNRTERETLKPRVSDYNIFSFYDEKDENDFNSLTINGMKINR